MSSHTYTRKATKEQFEESERRRAESQARIAKWSAQKKLTEAHGAVA